MRRAGWLALLVVVAVIALGGMEAWRRSRVVADSLPEPAPAKADATGDWAREFTDPERFSRTCEKVREVNIRRADEHKRLAHVEEHVAFEIDKSGNAAASEKAIDEVWFENGDEYRRTIRREFLKTGKIETRPTAPVKSPKAKEVFPFSREEKPGDYHYSFEGFEEIEGRPTARIGFEPAGPPAGLFRGRIWVEPRTLEPLRFEASLAKNPAFVDRLFLRFEWAPFAGHGLQLARSMIDGAGGFALIQKHYRLESTFRDYRPNVRPPELKRGAP